MAARTRRDILRIMSLGAVAAAGRPAIAANRPAIKALAFDGFPIIDPRPIAARAESLFPGRGAELMNTWRARQFEYSWLRTLGGHYADFWQVTGEALDFAGKSIGLDIAPAQRDALMQTYLELQAWPDAAAALRRIKMAGLRMAFLSNFTAPMLDAALQNAGLAELFEDHLTTDLVRAFKPDPRAYRMGLDGFGLAREEILFVASAGWDAAGAKWFGYTTFWVNRPKAPVEDLGVAPDGIGGNMDDLIAFLGLESL